MSEIAVITVASHMERQSFDLIESAKKFGIVPIFVGFSGRLLDGHVEKMILTQKVLPEIQKRYPITMYVDAFDCLFVDTAESIVDEFKKLSAPIVFSAEKFCFPPEQHRIDRHPVSPTPYRFLNTGNYIGYTEHLIEAFRIMNPQSWDKKITDQAFVQDFYFNNVHMIKLDVECRMFQSLVLAEDDVEYGRWIRNKATNSYPKIIHGNGGWDMSKALAWINGVRLP